MTYDVGRCLLRQHLNRAEMSQQELSKLLGISKQQVNSYVTNTRIMSLRTAKNIAAILECRIEDLYEWPEVGKNE